MPFFERIGGVLEPVKIHTNGIIKILSLGELAGPFKKGLCLVQFLPVACFRHTSPTESAVKSMYIVQPDNTNVSRKFVNNNVIPPSFLNDCGGILEGDSPPVSQPSNYPP